MINLKGFLIVIFSAVLIGCGGSGESQQEPQSETEAVADTTSSAIADSMVTQLDESSQELQSTSEEAQKAVDELSEEN
jgi:hypothetical protein